MPGDEDGKDDGDLPGEGTGDNGSGNPESNSGNGVAENSTSESNGGNAGNDPAQGGTQMPAAEDQTPAAPRTLAALIAAAGVTGTFWRMRLAPHGKHAANR